MSILARTKDFLLILAILMLGYFYIFNLINLEEKNEITTCVNILTTKSKIHLYDAGLYRKRLQSEEYVLKSNFGNILPAKVDLFLESAIEVPDRFYPKTKGYWWMPNMASENTNQLHSPNLLLVIAKYNYAFDWLKNYRQVHNLNYCIINTKHTSSHYFHEKLKSKKYLTFLHLAGKSKSRNTDVILKLWAHNPTWPKITILTERREHIKLYNDLSDKRKLGNVRFVTRPVTSKSLRKLIFRTTFHLCTSSREKYGHYINQARAAEGIIITGNAPPMNELIDSDSGILIGRIKSNSGFGIPNVKITENDIKNGIIEAMKLTRAERAEMGKSARKKFLRDLEYFNNVMTILNSTVCGSGKLEELAPFMSCPNKTVTL